jgi:hypothetical protein
MKEMVASLFDCMTQEGVDAVCIPTNGNYAQSGAAIMESGHALEIKKRFPKTQINLGKKLRYTGNNLPFVIGAINYLGEYVDIDDEDFNQKKYKCLIISFPIKDHFKSNSYLELILQSCKFLLQLKQDFNLKNIFIPQILENIEELNWDKLKTEMSSILGDEFTIVCKE